MRWLYTIPLRVRSIFQRRAVESDLDEELKAHLDHRIAHEMTRGQTYAQARAIALEAIGGIEHHDHRPSRGTLGIEFRKRLAFHG